MYRGRALAARPSYFPPLAKKKSKPSGNVVAQARKGTAPSAPLGKRAWEIERPRGEELDWPRYRALMDSHEPFEGEVLPTWGHGGTVRRTEDSKN